MLIHEIRVRLTPDQKARVEAEAERRGLGVASWVRSVLHDALPSAPTVEAAGEASNAVERKPTRFLSRRTFLK
jgi:hypothetical protein